MDNLLHLFGYFRYNLVRIPNKENRERRCFKNCQIHLVSYKYLIYTEKPESFKNKLMRVTGNNHDTTQQESVIKEVIESERKLISKRKVQ